MANPISYHSQADVEAHNRLYGHPADLSNLPLAVREAELALRQAYLAAGMTPPPPRTSMLSIIGVPEITGGAGHCHVCGTETASDQNLAAHALPGFEEALDPQGQPVRLLVTHCDRHRVGAPHCARGVYVQGSGLPEDSPGGFCEPVTREADLGGVLFPGAKQLARFTAWALGCAGLYLAANTALVFSRAQSKADMEGTPNKALAVQDAVNGHGYNNGNIKIYSGAAPGTADAAETGTIGINWQIPAATQAFSATSAATPPATILTAIANVAAIASITAGYGRLLAAGDDGTLSTTQSRIMFDVGTSGASMNFNTLIVVPAAIASLTSLSITHG